MLAVVAAASAGTMRLASTPNWANGASTAMTRRPNRSHESEPALEWSAVWPFVPVIDRLVI